ncbi:MAG: alkaline phosphatase family protein [Clostridia bacterium]|nr:alkaline phosphatase family protein [Clostridia bacterium]
MKYENIVLPDYNHCILSTITSVLKYYNVQSEHKSLESLDKVLKQKRYKNVIFFILDGMGEHILNNISENGYFSKNKIDCITSVYPSTTTAALTSYYSGCAPYETGWIAWSQYFKEYGRALDMFSHNDSYYREPLRKPLRDVYKTDMNYESVFEKIEKANPGIRTFDIGPEYAERRGIRKLVADNIDELIMNIKDVCELSGEKFIMAYCDNPDGILHKFGTDSKEAKDFVLSAEEKLKELRECLPDDSIIIVSADHGHKNIEKSYSITDYPELWECFLMPPTLESRIVNFYIKENMRDVFKERFNRVFGEEFWLMDRNEFLNERKFLGTGKKHHKIDDFIGDFVALSVAGSMIRLQTFLAEGKPVKKSTHCGLSKDEMEVPVIVLK